MNKIAVFGGSFDPVTKAHIDLVKKLSSRYDEVIVVPCRVSPFKTSTAATPYQRLEMLDVALEGIPDVCVDTFELNSEGANYTYLTLEHLTRPDAHLYLIMGSEMVIELERWKNIRRIAELAELVVVPRPGFPFGRSEKEKAERLFPSRWSEADFVGETGSSSEVRVSFAMGRPNLFLTDGIAAYAEVNKLYGDYVYVNELYRRFGMKQSRIDHSYSTALCGIALAKRVCADTGKAITALLLHDVGKYVTKEQAEDMGVKFDGRIDGMPLPIRHAEIGAELLRQIVGITDNDIIEAVRWHTTGRPNMTPLEKVVYLADYIEPTRSFPTVDYLRQETAKSIDDGLRAALKNSVEYVNADEIYPVTIQAYNFYKENK